MKQFFFNSFLLLILLGRCSSYRTDDVADEASLNPTSLNSNPLFDPFAGPNTLGTDPSLPPTVNSIYPVYGSSGILIQVIGSNFSPTTSINFTLSGNSATCSQTLVSPHLINCLVPSLPGSGAATITAFDSSSGLSLTSSAVFTYASLPSPSSITPSAGAPGTSINIAGSGFVNPTVTLGGQACVVNTSTSTSINCTTPSLMSPGSARLIVTNSNEQDSSNLRPQLYFTFLFLGDILSAGGTHACAQVNSGIKCWGTDSTPNTIPNFIAGSPQAISSASQVNYLSSGDYASCVVALGQVSCFPSNGPTPANMGSPIPNLFQAGSTVGGVSSIATGLNHTCVISLGQLFCWGDNTYGQAPATGPSSGYTQVSTSNNATCVIGAGTVSCLGTPASVAAGPPNALNVGATQVCVGNGYACGIFKNSVQCWGDTIPTGSPTSRVTQISCGYSHACAIQERGSLYCWGTGAAEITGPNAQITQDAELVAAGNQFTCAVFRGTLQCWGTGGGGAAQQPSFLTKRLGGISGGGNHTCFIQDGNIHCFGLNNYGQSGSHFSKVFELKPVVVTEIPATQGVSKISGGFFHSCALIQGAVKCWGDNSSYQLGNDQQSLSWTPNYVESFAQDIATGKSHSCSLTSGVVSCWGSNRYGQLGRSATVSAIASPTPVQSGNGFLNQETVAITAGLNHTCALEKGGVFCWGDNSYGQLGVTPYSLVAGVPSGIASTSAAQNVNSLGNFSGVQSIFAGAQHTCALVNGTIQCWGSNRFGQIGNGSFLTTASPVPVVVTTSNPAPTNLGAGSTPFILSAVDQIFSSSSASHNCALRNGIAYCWGLNTLGQLGLKMNINQSTPVKIIYPNIQYETGIQTMGLGGFITCFIQAGQPYCTGSNAFGQLGNGNQTNVNQAVPVLFY